MEQAVLVRLDDVSVAYDGKYVLEDVNLSIFENDFLGVIGPNGGGKTTLVKIILGLLPPQKGRVQYFSKGQPTNKLKIGYLPQYNSIDKKFPITVREVILSGLLKKHSFFHRYVESDRLKVDMMINRMGLDGYADVPIGQLSGGQMQRTLLGRALIAEPQLLILDEPNTYIDKRFEAKLYEILTEVNKQCAVLLVSHDIGTVLQSVKSIACVSGRLDYHPSAEISSTWLEQHLGCPIELIGHGNLPHRVLKEHHHS